MTERTEIDERRATLLRKEAEKHLQAWKDIMADYHRRMAEEASRHGLRLADIYSGRVEDEGTGACPEHRTSEPVDYSDPKYHQGRNRLFKE